ncbi:MAG: branched-chain amino acid ABC transporter permease [Propionibacteriaceae bacterium]|jgi:branched-subunit amino acid ABC-type transport system permease component|nr:branched-chain amino acid ABC transporter permease [Propionibacteriaceae bacterium]
MNQLLSAVINGVATGVPLFLVASGFTLIYGVMGVLNFAHGAFFMFGAYCFAVMLAGQALSLPLFLLYALGAAAVIAVLGVLSERLVFARLYNSGHMINLLAAYALMLMLIGLSILIFGTTTYHVPRPSPFRGAVHIGTVPVPAYNLFVIAAGLVVAAGLWFLLNKSGLGMKIRAVAHDRTTARALGVRAPLVGMGVFALGCALAGLAGALDSPMISVAQGMDATFAIQFFVVVIIGGLGSTWGALFASLLVGLMESLLVYYAPAWSQYGMYILVVFVLLLRPQGLFVRGPAITHS